MSITAPKLHPSVYRETERELGKEVMDRLAIAIAANLLDSQRGENCLGQITGLRQAVQIIFGPETEEAVVYAACVMARGAGRG